MKDIKPIHYVEAVAIILFGIATWWVSQANDTIKNAATKADVEDAIGEAVKTRITRPDVERIVATECTYVPDKQKVIALENGLNDLRLELRNFQVEQRASNTEVMRILIQVNQKIGDK